MNFFQELKRTIEKGVEQAGQVSQRMLEISRLSLKLKNKKDEMEKVVHQLGWQVYRAWEPEKQFSENDEIKRTLERCLSLKQQIENLEKEIHELKTLNITNHETVETVKLDPAPGQSEPQLATSADPVQPIQPSPQTVKPAAIVYICPFCARQVSQHDSTCPHCKQRYY